MNNLGNILYALLYAAVAIVCLVMTVEAVHQDMYFMGALMFGISVMFTYMLFDSTSDE
jgi:hypothetical protein